MGLTLECALSPCPLRVAAPRCVPIGGADRAAWDTADCAAWDTADRAAWDTAVAWAAVSVRHSPCGIPCHLGRQRCGWGIRVALAIRSCEPYTDQTGAPPTVLAVVGALQRRGLRGRVGALRLHRRHRGPPDVPAVLCAPRALAERCLSVCTIHATRLATRSRHVATASLPERARFVLARGRAAGALHEWAPCMCREVPWVG